jgi:hypothetical protein
LLIRWSLLIGRSLLVLLIRRSLLVLLIRRSLLIPLIRGSLLILGPLLILLILSLVLSAALLHLRAVFAPLLTELILLVARENAHELSLHFPRSLSVDRAALRMRLRISADDRLDSLLLIA